MEEGREKNHEGKQSSVRSLKEEVAREAGALKQQRVLDRRLP